jgi:hypothetical protein
LSPLGSVIAAVSDEDLACSVLTVRLRTAAFREVSSGLAGVARLWTDRPLTIEFMASAASELPNAQDARELETLVESATSAPVTVASHSPSIKYKVRLEGMPWEGAQLACRAVGGASSGLPDIAAHAAASAIDSCSLAVLDVAATARAPLHRALDVLAVECERYGARLGKAALLSHIPLTALLAVMQSRAGLDVSPSQIIETHLA